MVQLVYTDIGVKVKGDKKMIATKYPTSGRERELFERDRRYERLDRIRDAKMLQDRMELKARDALTEGVLLGLFVAFVYYSFKFVWWTTKSIFKLLWWMLKGIYYLCTEKIG